MGSSLDLRGVYVPLVTPFTGDDKPALDEIKRLANESFDAGAAGIVALGTTGEPATLTTAEKDAVIEAIGSVCRERSGQFIIGAGSNSTADSIEAVRAASAKPGVAALLSVVPYYTRPSEAGIVEHFKALASASAVPVIVYNIPYRTGRGLGAEALLQLANTPNIAGLKQAVGGVDMDTMTLMAQKPDDFHVLCGEDAFVFPLLALGAAGAIAASAHVCTQQFVAMVDLAHKGEMQQARALADVLLPVCQTLFAEPSPGVIKGILAQQGRISTPNLRLPMTPASSAAVTAALEAIASVK